MLHVISSWCVARHMHMIVPWPLEHTCWRQFKAQWGDCKSLQLYLKLCVSMLILLLSLLLLLLCFSHYRMGTAYLEIKGPSSNWNHISWVLVHVMAFLLFSYIFVLLFFWSFCSTFSSSFASMYYWNPLPVFKITKTVFKDIILLWSVST